MGNRDYFRLIEIYKNQSLDLGAPKTPIVPNNRLRIVIF